MHRAPPHSRFAALLAVLATAGGVVACSRSVDVPEVVMDARPAPAIEAEPAPAADLAPIEPALPERVAVSLGASLLVIDARTFQVVTAFGAEFTTGMFGNGGAVQSFPVEQRPGGLLEYVPDPAVSGFRITAPGYSTVIGAFSSDRQRGTRVVRVTKSPSVFGRAVLAGKPSVAAQVTLSLDSLCTSDPFTGGDVVEAEERHYERTRSVPVDSARQGTMLSGSDGTFGFDGLVPWKYRLVLRSGGARLSVDPLEVSGDYSIDLGDLALRQPAELRGTLLAPASVRDSFSTAGLKVSASVFELSRSVLTGREGRFEFLDMPAGSVLLRVEDADGRAAYGFERTVVLDPGRAKDIEVPLTFDGSPRSFAARVEKRLRFAVSLDGKPCGPGFLVTLEPPDLDAPNVTQVPTDSASMVELEDPAFAWRTILVTTPEGVPIGEFARERLSSASSEHAPVLDCVTGALQVSWPELPGCEQLFEVSFQPVKDWLSPAGKHPRLAATHALDTRDGRMWMSGRNRAEIPTLQPGAHDWFVHLNCDAAEGRQVSHSYRASFTIVPGARTALTLADR